MIFVRTEDFFLETVGSMNCSNGQLSFFLLTWRRRWRWNKDESDVFQLLTEYLFFLCDPTKVARV